MTRDPLKALEALADIVTNATVIPDPARDGLADVYAVPLDDIERAAEILKGRRGDPMTPIRTLTANHGSVSVVLWDLDLFECYHLIEDHRRSSVVAVWTDSDGTAGVILPVQWPTWDEDTLTDWVADECSAGGEMPRPDLELMLAEVAT